MSTEDEMRITVPLGAGVVAWLDRVAALENRSRVRQAQWFLTNALREYAEAYGLQELSEVEVEIGFSRTPEDP